MSKSEKNLGIPAHRDTRNSRPVPERHLPRKKAGKVYPPHWEVSQFGQDTRTGEPHQMVRPHLRHGRLRSFTYDTVSEAAIRFGEDPYQPRTLQSVLALLAREYPETKTWPVRFLQGGVVECGDREVLS